MRYRLVGYAVVIAAVIVACDDFGSSGEANREPPSSSSGDASTADVFSDAGTQPSPGDDDDDQSTPPEPVEKCADYTSTMGAGVTSGGGASWAQGAGWTVYVRPAGGLEPDLIEQTFTAPFDLKHTKVTVVAEISRSQTGTSGTFRAELLSVFSGSPGNLTTPVTQLTFGGADNNSTLGVRLMKSTPPDDHLASSIEVIAAFEDQTIVLDTDYGEVTSSGIELNLSTGARRRFASAAVSSTSREVTIRVGGALIMADAQISATYKVRKICTALTPR